MPCRDAVAPSEPPASHKKVPWPYRTLKKVLEAWNNSFQSWLKNPTHENWESCQKKRNDATLTLRKAKKNYYGSI